MRSIRIVFMDTPFEKLITNFLCNVFLWGSKKFFTQLLSIRRSKPDILWDFLLMGFIVSYFIRFLFEEGATTQNFIFYFFIGYILSYHTTKTDEEHIGH